MLLLIFFFFASISSLEEETEDVGTWLVHAWNQNASTYNETMCYVGIQGDMYTGCLDTLYGYESLGLNYRCYPQGFVYLRLFQGETNCRTFIPDPESGDSVIYNLGYCNLGDPFSRTGLGTFLCVDSNGNGWNNAMYDSVNIIFVQYFDDESCEIFTSENLYYWYVEGYYFLGDSDYFFYLYNGSGTIQELSYSGGDWEIKIGDCFYNEQYNGYSKLGVLENVNTETPHYIWSYCYGEYSAEFQCSGHGSCIGYDLCECDEDWNGDEVCSITSCNGISKNSESVCSGNGECITFDECKCNSGWKGFWCENLDDGGDDEDDEDDDESRTSILILNLIFFLCILIALM